MFRTDKIIKTNDFITSFAKFNQRANCSPGQGLRIIFNGGNEVFEFR